MPGSNPIRRQFLTVCGTALTLMFAVSTRAGDAPRGARQASELSQSLLSIIDTVIENHVDPPPRQTLVLEFCRAIASTQRPPLGLGRAVSDADPEQLRAIIAEHLAAVKTDAADAIALSALQNTLQAHAHTQLTKRSDHRVNEQLAANRYVGIGIAIGMNDQVPMMMKVFEGGPADVSGAKEGEFILAVNGVKTSGRPLTEVIDLLRGPAGTKVEIELAKDKTTTRDVTMIRDVVPLKQVEDFGVIEPGIASVTINSITGSIVRDLRRLTPKIYEHEIHSIVLRVKPHQPDERSSLLLANALIDGKPIGGIETVTGIEPVVADPDLLWPGVQIAIMLQSSPQDSLAWALAALQRERGVYLDIAGQVPVVLQVDHAWLYDTVDMAGTEFVIVVPTGRLLKVDGTSTGNDLKYATMTRTAHTIDTVNQIDMRMIHSQRTDVTKTSQRLPPLQRAIEALKRKSVPATKENAANPPN